MNILLGGSGTGTAYNILLSIKKYWPGDFVVAIDMTESHLVTASVFADKFVQVPRADSSQFLHSLVNLINDYSIDLFIPVLNGEIACVPLLIEQTGILCWQNKHCAKLLDKVYAKEFCIGLSIPVPQLMNPLHLRGNKSHEMEVVVKPRVGSGSHGVKKLDVNEAVQEVLGSSDFFIEEMCLGPEVTVDSFYSSDFSAVVCRERLEIKSGVSTKNRIFFDSILAEYAARISKALDREGSLCFQVMKNTHGAWVVTDLNTRTGAGTALSKAIGYDFAAANLALTKKLQYRKFLEGYELNAREYFVTRQYSEFVTGTSQI